MNLEKTLRYASIIIFVFLIFFLAFISVRVFFWDDVYQKRETTERTYNIDESTTSLLEQLNAKPNLTNGSKIKNKPFTVLLLGLDTKNLSGRSDTMIVAVINPETKAISLVSIPRDTRVRIHGKGYEKITHAHAYNLNTAIYTVEDFLQIPIDYYATINLQGFTKLIDAIGGLEIDVEKDLRFHDRLSKQYVSLSKGVQTLDGDNTLHYARFRGDAEGDFGRIRRQQQIISSIIDQTMHVRNITKTNDILKAIGNNIKTDVSFTDMTKMLLQLGSVTGDNIEKINIKSHSEMIGGISYVIISDTETANLQSKLKQLVNQ